MKSYTDIEQSKKLAEILPIESADMCYRIVAYNPNDTHEYQPYCFVGTLESDIPCWSLAALIDILPILERKGYQKAKLQLFYNVHINKWIVDSHVYTTDAYDNPIDACVEMIYILKERNLL